MTKPRLVYAANRDIGIRGLSLFLEYGWPPVALLVPEGRTAEGVRDMRRMVPHVPVLEGTEFREERGLSMLRTLDPDYVLSVHFPYIIPRDVLRIPRLGTLNLHPSYLPYNRGWHTPSWAILEGTPYGATLHWVDEGIDTGDIAMQQQIEPRPHDTADSLYQRVLALELEILRRSFHLLVERRLPRVSQQGPGTVHLKNDLQKVRRLDLSETKRTGDVVKHLLGLTTNKWEEAAFFEVGGKSYRIRVETAEVKDADETRGGQ